MDKRRIILSFVADRYAGLQRRRVARAKRQQLLLGLAAGVLATGRSCVYLWYWLEYDLNIFAPVPSDYLKHRLR